MFDHEALRRASAQYKTTLRETSCDDKNRKHMVDSTAEAVNVDQMMVQLDGGRDVELIFD